MDAVETIVMALAIGALEGVKSTAEQTIKDAYNGLKKLIKNKYENVSINLLEEDPGSKNKIKAELLNAQADKDPEILKKADELLRIIKDNVPHVPESTGFHLIDVEIGILEIQKLLTSSGKTFEIERGKIDRISIDHMEVGSTGGDDSPPKA